MDFQHTSVLLNETIDGLNIKQDGIYIDGTMGGGGHSEEICKRLSNNGKLIGIDQDEEAINASYLRLKNYKQIISIYQSNFKNIKDIINKEGYTGVDGIILDLGVSSHQLDKDYRGFSYRVDAPLDMRMDTRNSLTAEILINSYTESKLFRIIRQYGEEKYAKSIARNIIKYREQQPIKTTGQLVDIIKRSMPIKAHFVSGHPAKRTFQAIRIELNQELDVLKNSLTTMIELLNDKGRLCIITFHSLEDRIVKNTFRNNENPCTCPRDFPICICNQKSKGKVITKKPIIPTEKEIDTNKRSKSAKLRIFERKID